MDADTASTSTSAMNGTCTWDVQYPQLRCGNSLYMILLAIIIRSVKTDTYDRRTLKTRLPVRSVLLKQRTSGLVVMWVNTGEYRCFMFLSSSLSCPSGLLRSSGSPRPSPHIKSFCQLSALFVILYVSKRNANLFRRRCRESDRKLVVVAVLRRFSTTGPPA
jgi:hypothetical protein